MPPFTARHSPLELLEIVRAVSQHTAPDAPTRLSGRQWDLGRVGAGHAQAPRAFSIAKRLGVAWSDVLRVAHTDAENMWRLLANLQADKGRKGITLAGVFVALRQAAHRLDQPSVNRTDYARARDQILKSTRRTRHAGTAARAIPSLTQVEELLRQHGLDWSQAVKQAGLAQPPRPSHSGLTPDEAVRTFIADVGKPPHSHRQLRRWSSARQISIKEGPKPAAATRAAIDAVLEERRQAGLGELPRADANAVFERSATTRVTGPVKLRKKWNRETLLDGMALAVNLLGAGQQLDQRSLKRVAAERRDLPIPTYSTVNRHLRTNYPDETWEQWRREATTRARAARGDREA